MPISGTEGYAEEAEALFRRYESIPFDDAHRAVLHLIPAVPGHVLDIGSGTGRDAAWFAGRGHAVVAVEPTDAMRLPAMALHPSPRINWLNDSLPDLALLRARGETFDLVMLTAVWMHLDEPQRRQAMPNLAALMRPGGTLIMKIRHGAGAAGTADVRGRRRRNDRAGAGRAPSSDLERAQRIQSGKQSRRGRRLGQSGVREGEVILRHGRA